MKLVEAIEIGDDVRRFHLQRHDGGAVNALKLLIEAGKREELYRANNPELHFVLLPGETED